MSAFSDKLRSIIEQSGISIAALADQSGISESMLYKIQSGTRMPDSVETLERLLRSTFCALPDKIDLVRSYRIERIGAGHFAWFQEMKGMLSDLSDDIDPPVKSQLAFSGTVPVVTTGVGNVNRSIQTFLAHEVSLEGGYLELIFPAHNGYLLEYLATILPHCHPGFQYARHLICFKSTATDEATLYNMEVIRRVLPKMLLQDRYDPWYSYLPDPYDYTVPFPYCIIGSSGVIQISGDFQTCSYLQNPEIVNQCHRSFRFLSSRFSPILRSGATNVSAFVQLYRQMFESKLKTVKPVILQGAPAVLPCLAKDTMSRFLTSDDPSKPPPQDILDSFGYFKQRGYVTFFTVDGLRNLIHSGILSELRGTNIPRFSREEILSALERMILLAREDIVEPYVFRENNFLGSFRFNMSLYGNKLLSICEMPQRRAVFADITEGTLCRVLKDYIKYADALGDIFSKQESIAILEEVVTEFRTAYP